jgi:hypothetical protein
MGLLDGWVGLLLEQCLSKVWRRVGAGTSGEYLKRARRFNAEGVRGVAGRNRDWRSLHERSDMRDDVERPSTNRLVGDMTLALTLVLRAYIQR